MRSAPAPLTQLSKVIDIIIAIGIVGGTATSLGLGVPLVSAFSSELFGVPDVLTTKVIVLVIWLKGRRPFAIHALAPNADYPLLESRVFSCAVHTVPT